MGEGTSGGHAQAELPQVAFEDLQGKKLHSLSKPPLPVLHHLHSKKKKKKKLLPEIQTECPLFQFVLTTSCPALRHQRAWIYLLDTLPLGICRH